MLRITQSVDDAKGNRWLDFILDAVPNLGAQIYLPATLDAPFNIFWWGVTDVDQLKRITLELSDRYQRMNDQPGHIRSVCYGDSWKEIIENEPGDDLHVPHGTLNIRFEQVPSQVQNLTERRSNLITWARFHSYPRPNDEHSIESVGILIPYRLFLETEELFELFFRGTTLRPLPHPEFTAIMKRLKLEFPVAD
jgi:hypothetical protein